MDNVNSHAQRANGGKKRRAGVGYPAEKASCRLLRCFFMILLYHLIFSRAHKHYRIFRFFAIECRNLILQLEYVFLCAVYGYGSP